MAQTEQHAEPCIRIVVTGDNHLAPRLSRLPAPKATARRERLRAAFAACVSASIERGADLFIQAGDLFDVPDPINQDREFVAAQVVRLRDAGIMVCAVSGNHDMPRQSVEQGGAAPLGVYGTLGALHYFPSAAAIRPILLAKHGLRLAIGGVSNDPGRLQGEDPLAEVTLDDPDGIVASADAGLLIVHAAITDGSPNDLLLLSEAECIIRPASLARLHGFQVVVTGHIHRYQRRRIAGIDTIVCGPSERMDFGDPSDAPGYAWLEVGKGGLRHDEHARLPAQPRHTLTLRTAEIWPHPPAPSSAKLGEGEFRLPQAAKVPLPTEGGEGLGVGPTAAIIARLEPICAPDALVRLRLEGEVTREQYRELDLRRIYNWGQAHCFAFELSERGLHWTDGLVAGAEAGVTRGERVAPRQVLAEVADAQLAEASPQEAELWQAARAALLAEFDALGGDEA